MKELVFFGGFVGLGCGFVGFFERFWFELIDGVFCCFRFSEVKFDLGTEADARFDINSTMAESFAKWVRKCSTGVADGDLPAADLEFDTATIGACNGVSQLFFKLGFELRIVGLDIDVDVGWVGVI